MNAHSVRAGLLAAAALGAFYVTVIVWASGLDHLADQAETDWPYLVVILAGFATQIAVVAELRHRHRARHLEHVAAGAGAGASTVGMIACCAHHLADLAPLIGVSAAATFLTDWRTEFMLAGITINAVAVTVAIRRLRADNRYALVAGGAWRAA